MADVRVLPAADAPAAVLASARRLMDVAFDDFTDDDWTHALGGWHVIIERGGDVVAHAALVPRRIVAGEHAFAAGYVEAVAVRPDLQGTGLGSGVMAAINDLVRARFELGALSTGEWHFYERLGWERWQGPAFVHGRDGGRARAEDEDDGIMVLRVPASAGLDLTQPIACDERDGDSW